ncbi:MAG: hypothetical protein ACE5PV_04380 [Candidatus Poribacteria bacterium]
MRNFNRILAFVLVVGLVLTSAYIISAQQRNESRQFPRQRQQRRQMDPAAIMERRLERIMRELNLSFITTSVPATLLAPLARASAAAFVLPPIEW